MLKTDIPIRKLPTPFQGDALRFLTMRRPLAVMLVSIGVVAALGTQAFRLSDGRIESRVKYDYNLLLVIALVLGLAPFLQHDHFFVLIAFVGAIALVWLAIGMFRSLPELHISMQADGETRYSRLILTGALLNYFGKE